MLYLKTGQTWFSSSDMVVSRPARAGLLDRTLRTCSTIHVHYTRERNGGHRGRWPLPPCWLWAPGVTRDGKVSADLTVHMGR